MKTKLTPEVLEKAFYKASILGDFDWKVNYIMYKIRAMGKLEEKELAVIRYEINKAFEPIIDKLT